MKNNRVFRCCAIVLASILMVCSAGLTRAAAFTDDAQIGAVYTEAIAAMTEKNILSGYPDGSFQPLGTLTREQAAKIIAYAVLGAQASEKLTSEKAPFDDVAAKRWSAPYIAWCVDKGILNGYGNGAFGPEDQLTGMQFAKMLLCAFRGEGNGRYTGAGWADAVQTDGQELGLFEGDETMCSHDPLQRQQAALMAYHAGQWEPVEPSDPGAEPAPDQQPDTPPADPGAGDPNEGEPDPGDENELPIMPAN